MNYIKTRFIVIFLGLGLLMQPLSGHVSAIGLLELINAHNAPSKKISGNASHSNKKTKQPRNTFSALKQMYVTAKLTAAKPINYVVKGKLCSKKNFFYGIAGLASLLLVAHSYIYMFDLRQIEDSHKEKETPHDNDLSTRQVADNSEQVHDEQSEWSDDPENPVQIDADAIDKNQKTEELNSLDVNQDMQKNNPTLADSSLDNSGNSSISGTEIVLFSVFAVTTLAIGCFLGKHGDEIVADIIREIRNKIAS